MKSDKSNTSDTPSIQKGQAMLYSDEYAEAIEGLCSVVYPRGEDRDQLRDILTALIEDIVRKERGLPSITDDPT